MTKEKKRDPKFKFLAKHGNRLEAELIAVQKAYDQQLQLLTEHDYQKVDKHSCSLLHR